MAAAKDPLCTLQVPARISPYCTAIFLSLSLQLHYHTFSAQFGIKDMIIRPDRSSSGFYYFSLINGV